MPILHLVDLVLVMSVNPGFGGQVFLDYTLEKVKKLKEIKDENGYNFLIEIDGGINNDNIMKIKDAGCDIIVAGTAVFGSKDIIKTTTELKTKL